MSNLTSDTPPPSYLHEATRPEVTQAGTLRIWWESHGTSRGSRVSGRRQLPPTRSSEFARLTHWICNHFGARQGSQDQGDAVEATSSSMVVHRAVVPRLCARQV